MELKTYTVPSAAYPRYDYSLKLLVSMHKRVGILMEDLELRNPFKEPQFDNATVIVLTSPPDDGIIDELTIQLKPTETVRTECSNIRDVPTLLRQCPINEKSPILIVIPINENVHSIEPYTDILNNVSVVVRDENARAALKQKIDGQNCGAVCIATKHELGKEIAGLLERVVFRNIAEMLAVLKGLLNAAKQPSVVEVLKQEISDHWNTSQMCNYFQGWITEFSKQLSELPRIQQGTTEEKGRVGKQDTAAQTPEDLLVVPGYLKEIPEISKQYTVRKSVWYELIYRLSKSTAQNFEQKFVEVYKGIPKVIRDLFPEQLDVHGIRDEIGPKLVQLLDSHLVDEEITMHLDKIHGHFQRSLKKIIKTIIPKVNELTLKLPVVVDMEERLRLLQDNEQTITGFIGEIMGMFNRSKVPNSERPTSPVLTKKRLNEKMVNKLFEDVKEVKGCGYRYNKLTVFFEEEKAAEGIDDENINSKVKKVLTSYDISDYELIPTTKSVKHYRQVGAKIQVSRCGTLGGFAYMDTPKSGRKLCALLSKHVVNGANDLFLVPTKQAEKVSIGSMVKARKSCNYKGLVDVAAAVIHENERELCDTSFKNSSGDNMPSVLYDFNDTSFLQGLRVHIFGATTGLGMGTITIPEYYVNESRECGCFVLIEDIEEFKGSIRRFSSEGDSGAIICADDPDGEYIHVISMLIGCNNYDKIRDPTVKGLYLSFRMTSAFEKLQEETNSSFSLCNTL